MSVFDRFRKQKRSGEQSLSEQSSIGWFLSQDGEDICIPGYTSLDKNPEVMTACRRIAELIQVCCLIGMVKRLWLWEIYPR